MSRFRKAPPVATAADLAKWDRFLKAVIAATECPGETKALMKARKAVSRGCAFPAGHHRTDSPIYRAWKEAEAWLGGTVDRRREMAAAARARAEACLEILSDASGPGPRPRIDVEG